MTGRAAARPYPLTESHVARMGGLELAAERLKVSTRTVRRMLEDGLTDEQADVVACELGDWPASLWPDYGLHADDGDEQLALFDEFDLT